MTAPTILDCSSHTVVIGCRCGWRSIALTEDAAQDDYRRHRGTVHRRERSLGRVRRKERHVECVLCGAVDEVMPFKGLCRRCQAAHRAILARSAYQARTRSA